MICKVHSNPLTFHASMKAVHGLKQGLVNSKALPRKRIKLLFRLDKNVTAKAVELHKSLLLGKRMASLCPRGWVGPSSSSGAAEHPLCPRGPLAGCWMTARHVPAADVAVATGCDFSACNATTVRDTQGDALVTSEAGGRWPRPGCHPRGLGSLLPGRVPAAPLHPPRAPPHLPSSAHGDFLPNIALELYQPKAACCLYHPQ